MDLITLQRSFKILIGLFGLILLLSTFLFAEGKKTLPPAPPEAQQDCDQNEPKALSSDSSISSPMGPSKGKTDNYNQLTPPQFENQQGTLTK